MTSAPQWFQLSIGQGIRSLITQGYDGQPALDILGVAISTWANDLWPEKAWDEDLDKPRIAEGFRRVRNLATRWPTQKFFMTQLPDRELPTMLPSRPLERSPEEVARRKKLIADLKDFAAHLSAESTKPPFTIPMDED